MDATKPTEAEFWDERYRAGRTPWDFRGVPRALTEFLRTTEMRGSALIPGCGSGYEVKAFHDHGWNVLAVDFSTVAVERARAVLGPLAEKVVLADFFVHDFGGRKFDLIYERTFLCSLPPERWPHYVRRVSELLRQGGRLVGFFLYGHEDEPPPYPLTETQAQSLFEQWFVNVADEPVADSLPLFAGRERWQAWAKREDDE